MRCCIIRSWARDEKRPFAEVVQGGRIDKRLGAEGRAATAISP